jgi:hypothetical protein
MMAAHENTIWDYCKHKYKWSDAVMDSISWETIQLARTRRTPTTVVQTSKILHGWLPVMHRQGFSTGVAQCPGCPHEDETFDHMLRCRNKDMASTRTKALQALRDKGTRTGTPTFFMDQFVEYITHTLTEIGGVPLKDQRTTMVFDAQNKIGPTMLIRGFAATAWEHLLADMGVANPRRQMVLLIRTLWEEVVMKMWTTRNHILHNNPNFTTELTHSQLGDRLLWYLQHKDQLSRQDQFLARYSATNIESMTTEIQREWVRHLDVARDAWTKEQQQLARGQTVLTQYFQRINRAI